jgi:hypothetical protein
MFLEYVPNSDRRAFVLGSGKVSPLCQLPPTFLLFGDEMPGRSFVLMRRTFIGQRDNFYVMWPTLRSCVKKRWGTVSIVQLLQPAFTCFTAGRCHPCWCISPQRAGIRELPSAHSHFWSRNINTYRDIYLPSSWFTHGSSQFHMDCLGWKLQFTVTAPICGSFSDYSLRRQEFKTAKNIDPNLTDSWKLKLWIDCKL